MMKSKPDAPELEPSIKVERRSSEGRSVEGGSTNSIRRPTSKQRERSLTRTYDQVVKDELHRNVKIRVGNKTETMPLIQANIRLLSNAALNGDLRAQLELAALYRKIDLESEPPGYDLSLLTDDKLRERLQDCTESQWDKAGLTNYVRPQLVDTLATFDSAGHGSHFVKVIHFLIMGLPPRLQAQRHLNKYGFSLRFWLTKSRAHSVAVLHNTLHSGARSGHL